MRSSFSGVKRQNITRAFLNIGNIAHGSGMALGLLMGCQTAFPRLRIILVPTILLCVFIGLLATTFYRPILNHTLYAGRAEASWGEEALEAGHYHEAAWWLRDAVYYRKDDDASWENLSKAYDHLGDKSGAAYAHSRAEEIIMKRDGPCAVPPYCIVLLPF